VNSQFLSPHLGEKQMKAVSFLSKAAVASLAVIVVQPHQASADVIDTLTPVLRLVADDVAGTNGSYVATWTDRVDPANQVFQPNEAGNANQANLPADITGNQRRPQLMTNSLNANGHNVLRFDASRGTIMSSFVNSTTIGQNPWYAGAHTWVVFFTRGGTDPTNSSSIMASYDGNDAFGENMMLGVGPLRGGGTSGSLAYDDGGQPNLGDSAQVTNGLAYNVGTTSRIVLVNGRAGAGSVQLYRDGVAEGAAGFGNAPFAAESNGARDLSIGGRTNPGFSGGSPSPYNTSGDIAEILIFNRALNATELAQVDAYLVATYIPEPASLGLLSLGGVLLVRRRKTA